MVRARVIGVPFTYSWRVTDPAPTLVCQIFFDAFVWVQPVTWRAPLMVGRAPGAACQTTVWPPVPESAAVKLSGVLRRYTPSASWTTMSSDMPLVRARTAVRTESSEQGWSAEQVLPLPDGEAYSVVAAAEAFRGASRAAATTTAAPAPTEILDRVVIDVNRGMSDLPGNGEENADPRSCNVARECGRRSGEMPAERRKGAAGGRAPARPRPVARAPGRPRRTSGRPAPDRGDCVPRRQGCQRRPSRPGRGVATIPLPGNDSRAQRSSRRPSSEPSRRTSQASVMCWNIAAEAPAGSCAATHSRIRRCPALESTRWSRCGWPM